MTDIFSILKVIKVDFNMWKSIDFSWLKTFYKMSGKNMIISS